MALPQLNKPRQRAFAVVLLLIIGSFFAWGFSHLPLQDARLAIDWKVLWSATHGFQATYGGGDIISPPWVLPLLWPLTSLPLAYGWGVLAFITVLVLLLSVPRTRQKSRWLAGVALLITAYPTLRQLVDGNLELAVIGGVMLALWAIKARQPVFLALGVLLAAAKIQASWLLLPFLAFWVLRNWPRRAVLQSAGALALFAVPSFIWRGGEWLAALRVYRYPGSAIDSNLRATLHRLGLPPLATWLVWGALAAITLWLLLRSENRLGRVQVGWLAAAALLLGPYAASNSVLTPLALGVIPFYQQKPFWGLALIALFNLPYLALGNPGLRVAWESSYWTMVLLLTWLVLGVFLGRLSTQNRQNA